MNFKAVTSCEEFTYYSLKVDACVHEKEVVDEAGHCQCDEDPKACPTELKSGFLYKKIHNYFI